MTTLLRGSTLFPYTTLFRSTEHGKQTRQDPPDLLGRYRPLLHHRQEQEEHPGQDGSEEVRSRRAQARDLQGRQDQVTLWPAHFPRGFAKTSSRTERSDDPGSSDFHENPSQGGFSFFARLRFCERLAIASSRGNAKR